MSEEKGFGSKHTVFALPRGQIVLSGPHAELPVMVEPGSAFRLRIGFSS
jgi:hypothetical protein